MNSAIVADNTTAMKPGSAYSYTANWLENVFDPSGVQQKQNALDRQFQIDYDSTKYQRAVKDLEAAGLNKWFAASNGINSGSSAASLSSSDTSGAGGNAKNVKDALNSAMKVIGLLLLLA